jgi:hypothetical protein
MQTSNSKTTKMLPADARRALVYVNERFIADLQKINRRLLRADQRPTKRER